jgi:hypothetical protein
MSLPGPYIRRVTVVDDTDTHDAVAATAARRGGWQPTLGVATAVDAEDLAGDVAGLL